MQTFGLPKTRRSYIVIFASCFYQTFLTFVKILMKKNHPFLYRTFKFLIKFYHVTSFFDPETLKIEVFFSNFARMFLFVTNYF